MIETLGSAELSGLQTAHTQSAEQLRNQGGSSAAAAEARLAQFKQDEVEISSGGRFAQKTAANPTAARVNSGKGLPKDIQKIMANLGPITKYVVMLMDEMPSKSLIETATNAQVALRKTIVEQRQASKNQQGSDQPQAANTAQRSPSDEAIEQAA